MPDMKGKAYNAKNIYHLLKSRQFINHAVCEVNKRNCTILEHGVPGTFLRQNIKRKWWRVMVEEQSHAFPVERSAFNVDDYLALVSREHVSGNVNLEYKARSSNEYKRMYLEVLKLNKGCLPFSIVSHKQRFNFGNDTDEIKNQGSDPFLSGLMRNEFVSQCYTAPSGVNRMLDFWLQRRLSWWKRYTRNPSKFSVSSSNDALQDSTDIDMPSSNGSRQVMSINYEFPWGLDSVEVIQNHGHALFGSLPASEEKLYMAKTTGGKRYIPHCIQCSMDLEMAETTFLIDAYHERIPVSHANKSSKASPVLQLHPQLSPFQSALLVTTDGTTTTTTTELHHICTKLEKDLQKAGVSVLDASRHGATHDAHFKRNDQLGIPYTLILNENTLLDGSIMVRCRDTEIMKPVHVSRAVTELQRNVNATLD